MMRNLARSLTAIVCIAWCTTHLGAQTLAPAEPPQTAKPAPVTPTSPAATPNGGITPTQPLPIEDLQPVTKQAKPVTSSEDVPGEAKRDPNLPHDLSPLAMFEQADFVVKGVMIGLALASMLTWTVWIYKTVQLFASRARLKSDLRAIGHQSSLAGALQTLGDGTGLLRSYIDVAALELRMSGDMYDKDGIKERVASRLERIEAAAVRGMNKGTGILATIGATAPFVGLFGTVWGIMNSFIGISKSQTTNLAVVAPGIAEALLATACGLVAAIPAVIIYNWFSRGIGVYRAMAGDASSEVMRMVSRDLDRPGSQRHAHAAE